MNGISARPLVFEKVLGQDGAITLFQNTLKSGKLSRAYILSGGWSVGKTTLASLFARAILCEHRDPVTMSPCNKCSSCTNFLRGAHTSYTEVDAANFGTKENMAAILGSLAYENGDGYRIIFLDEAHKISSAGKDALLLELEKPIYYDNTIFIFSTNEIGKMPGTLLSRCTRVPLGKPTHEHVFQKLMGMCQEMGVTPDRHALKNLAVWANGHFRDAENALNPLVLMGGITKDNVASYTSYDQEGTVEMLLALERDLSAALNKAEDLVTKYGAESIHSSIIRVLLEAVQYGLSGMSLDVPECVKGVYNEYGSRMGSILSHFVSRAKISEGKFLQAELVHAHYRFLKGDMDSGNLRFATQNTAQKPVAPTQQAKPTQGEGRPLSQQEQMRELKHSKGGKNTPISGGIPENIGEIWGQEVVGEGEVVSVRRS
jgi:DNA polymerase III subunit gamma/tau